LNIACRFYGFLLLAYPQQFRREFGAEMLQVFRDCYRTEAGKGSLAKFCLRTSMDLIVTVARERIDDLGRKGDFMTDNRRIDPMALLGCIAIIVVAFLLLTIGRKNGISSIIFFGHFLDALVTTGVVGNVVLLLLLKATKIDPVRAVLGTFAAVHAILLLFIVLVVSKSDPTFSLGSVLVGYVLSFLFWTGVHWVWTSRSRVLSHE
jgi:hypothetical protein